MFDLVVVENDVPPLLLPVSILTMLVSAYHGSHDEICGFLSGPLEGGCASVMVLMENRSTSPELAYEMGDDDLVMYAQVAEDEHLHTFAGFHSHVQHGPYPSTLDREHAAPDLPYQVIIGTGPTLAAYVGDFSLPAAITVVSNHVQCIRCWRVEHLDHNVPVGDHHFCKGEQS